MNTSLGLQENIAAALSYIPIICIVFLLIERENNFVRFHAIQSALIFSIAMVFIVISSVVSCFASFIPAIGQILSCVCTLAIIPFSIAYSVLIIFLAIKAYQREHFKLPIIGDYAEKVVYKP
ncbi:MAG: DUF4870 domain-containing protein [bacterium]